MRGFVHKRVHTRKDGKTSVLYYAVVETTAPGSTRRKKDYGRGYATRHEADKALRQRVTAVENKQFVATPKLTLGEYLTVHWLPLLKDRIKPTTLDGYARTMAVYVIPRLGGVKLNDLSVAHLNHMYAELRESGGVQKTRAYRDKPKPLSQKSVRNVHAILCKALNDAVDSGLLPVNVAARAKPPRGGSVSQTVDAWTHEELGQFLSYVREERLFACFLLASQTGMRRGELLGLRWEDVDLDAGVIAIRQTVVLVYTTPTIGTPKNSEARVVQIEPGMVGELRRHRAAQEEERIAWGDDYFDSGLVFPRENGTMMNPDRLSQLFDKFVRHAGIRRIKFHGLRHTHATLMLKDGVPVKVVSERLGHADPAFTMRIYQHVLSGMQMQAAIHFWQKTKALWDPSSQLPEPVVKLSPSSDEDENDDE